MTDCYLHCGDVLWQRRGETPPASLVVTSPPYNLGKDYGTQSDALDLAEYLDWSMAWLRAVLLSWTTPDARLALNVPLDTAIDGGTPMWPLLCQAAIDAGWHYYRAIVWNESNISRRTAWGSWMSPSAPCVTAPVEIIGLFSRAAWKRAARPDGAVADIERQDFLDWTLGLWTFPGESAKRVGHPAPFPLELPHRLIQFLTWPGDVVLDPFCGSGTTLEAAARLGRHAVGIDIEPEYVKQAGLRAERGGARVTPDPLGVILNGGGYAE